MCKIKNVIIESVELIESEFPNMDISVLSERVDILICQRKSTYNSMSDADKFDYLVDNIIEMDAENCISELERYADYR